MELLLLVAFARICQAPSRTRGWSRSWFYWRPAFAFHSLCMSHDWFLGYVINNTTVAMPTDNDTSGLHGRHVFAEYETMWLHLWHCYIDLDRLNIIAIDVGFYNLSIITLLIICCRFSTTCDQILTSSCTLLEELLRKKSLMQSSRASETELTKSRVCTELASLQYVHSIQSFSIFPHANGFPLSSRTWGKVTWSDSLSINEARSSWRPATHKHF